MENNSFAAALDVPDLELAQKSSAVARAEREKRQLVQYILKVENDLKTMVIHAARQEETIRALKVKIEALGGTVE